MGLVRPFSSAGSSACSPQELGGEAGDGVRSV